MSYVVEQIELAPIAGVHSGTGVHQATNWVVEPDSVPGMGAMAFTGAVAEVTTMLFAIADPVVPNWFGVAVPSGIRDFSRAHIFFHPAPAQAGYVDAQYADKTGKWPELFYYMERLGYQLDAAHRSQILIMPFLTESALSTWMLPANWQDIVLQILGLVRDVVEPGRSDPLSISQLVVSSYSVGIIYSDGFRKDSPDLSGVMAEIWDFDGRASSSNELSEALHSTVTVDVIKYDQIASADTSAYHVPANRWTQLPSPPTSFSDVHAAIRDFMFLDAAAVSGVGVLIDTGTIPATVTTGTVNTGGGDPDSAGTISAGASSPMSSGTATSVGTGMTDVPASAPSPSIDGTVGAHSASTGESGDPEETTDSGSAAGHGDLGSGNSDRPGETPGHGPTSAPVHAANPGTTGASVTPGDMHDASRDAPQWSASEIASPAPLCPAAPCNAIAGISATTAQAAAAALVAIARQAKGRSP